MATANRIIRQALGKLGLVSPGESVKPGDAADCLIALNTMLDQWRVESLFAVSTATVTAALPANTSSMTIGPTGDIVVASRPIRLEPGCFFTSGNLDYPIETGLTEAEYNSILLKEAGGLGPDVAFYDPAWPNGTISFFPQASSAVTLSLIVLTQLSAFPDLTTEISLAPGYEAALVFSLAEYVAADFEREPPRTVTRNAALFRNSIRRVNVTVPQLKTASPPWASGRWPAILAG